MCRANLFAGAGPWPPALRGARAFTLIEMMVVLVIVGIIVGLAVVRLPADDRAAEARRETERLAALLRLARDEAIVRARAVGLRLDRTGYRFVLREDGRWRELVTDPVFRPRTLPRHLDLDFHVDSGAVPMAAGKEDEAPTPPQVILSPSGESTPFELTIAGGDGPAHLLRGGATGRFILESPRDS